MAESNSSKSREELDLHEKSSSEAEKAPTFPQGPQPFPEGGAKAWLTVAGSAACLFVSFGWVNCVGIFEEYYQTHQLSQYTPSEIAWIPALQSRWSLGGRVVAISSESSLLTIILVFFMLFAGLLVGKLFDDHGPGLLLAGGTFLHVFGLMLASVSDNYVQILLSQSVCSAIGASMVFYPAVACVSSASMTPFLGFLSAHVAIPRYRLGSVRSAALLLVSLLPAHH